MSTSDEVKKRAAVWVKIPLHARAKRVSRKLGRKFYSLSEEALSRGLDIIEREEAQC